MRSFIIASALAAAALSPSLPASAQDGSFCLQKAQGGTASCIYQSMAACEQAKTAGATSNPNDICLIRSLVDASSIQGGPATVGKGEVTPSR